MIAVALPIPAGAAALTATIYKNPACGCCDGHAAYLRQGGIEVTVVETEELDRMRAEHGVPPELAGCHMMLIDGYVVDGHVPLASIERLLAERPAVTGITLPGMPSGSPGMGGVREGPFRIMSFGAGEPTLFSIE